MDINTKEHSPAEEIKELERLLEEKKRQLAERGEEREHKEIFREVFREKYAPPIPAPSVPPAVPPAVLPQALARDLKQKTREEQLNSLIQLAFEKGITSAMHIAKSATPWLLDELHDRLVDEYYEKLVSAHQVNTSA